MRLHKQPGVAYYANNQPRLILRWASSSAAITKRFNHVFDQLLAHSQQLERSNRIAWAALLLAAVSFGMALFAIISGN